MCVCPEVSRNSVETSGPVLEAGRALRELVHGCPELKLQPGVDWFLKYPEFRRSGSDVERGGACALKKG